MKATKHTKKSLSKSEQEILLETLKNRFLKYPKRHKGVDWEVVHKRLLRQPSKLWSLAQMEATGGEPDVVLFNKKTDTFTFMDCSPETPSGRRSWCFDEKALSARKENKPEGTAMGAAARMGVELLSEAQYRALQKVGVFDLKTSSWIATPLSIRALGGALFCDRRYDTVFVYHNGADSYYASRGFRASLEV
jgi:hypothetical protein